MTTTYIILAATGAVALSAFVALIVAPALSAYGRTSEKFAALMMSLVILVTLVSIGAAIGVAIFLNWDRIVQLI